LCTAGLPAIYTAILTSSGLPSWQYYAYLLLYIVAYMLDDAALVTIAVVTLGKRKLQQRAGRWLKLVSGLAILSLGAVLLVRPSWLGF
jgi:threonine/homoserine/homoserine lactone efflux protein